MNIPTNIIYLNTKLQRILIDEFLGCGNVQSLKVHHCLRIQMVLNGGMQHRATSLRLGKNYSIQLNMIHHYPKKWIRINKLNNFRFLK